MTVYSAPGTDGAVEFAAALRQLHRRRVGAAREGRVLREHLARSTASRSRGRPRHRRGRRARPRRRARAPRGAWGKTVADRARQHPQQIADRIEANLEKLAVAETWDNGKPVRETLAADLPLADRPLPLLRRRASAPRRAASPQIDDDTVAYHFHEPLGVVGQIIPWNFPILMAVVEARPGAGRRQLRRPQARRADARARSCVLIELIGDLLPAGRAQRRQRLRRRGRQAARLAATAIAQGRVHRRDHDRPADHAVRLARTSSRSPSSSAARARTSSSTTSPAERRRVLRQGARGLHDVRPQPGRGLHLPVARR